MHEQKSEALQDEPKTEKSASSPSTHYDSNPFTTAWGGIQKLLRTNAQTVVGVAFFNILLFAVMGLAAVALVLAIAAFVVKRDPIYQATLSGNSFLEFLNSMNDGSIYLTWAIGLAVCIFVVALTQSLQLNLAIAAAKNISLKFGALLKTSVRSVLPILGFLSLILLALLACVMVLALLSTFLGYITILIGFVGILAFIYVGLRLSYATYAIVDQHLGPVEAAKYSWKMSQGHIIETVGSSAVAWLILAIPSLILSGLARMTEGVPVLSGLFGLLDIVLLVVLVIAAAMSVAERYVQLQALASKQLSPTALSSFNYLAIALVIFLAPILNMLSPKLDTTNQNPTLPELYDTSPPASQPYDDSIYRLN